MAKQKRTSAKTNLPATKKSGSKQAQAVPQREPMLYTFRVGPHPYFYPSDEVQQAGTFTVLAAGDNTLDEVLEEMGNALLPFDSPDGFRLGHDKLDNARTFDSLGLRPGDELLITGMVMWQVRVEEVRPLTRPRQLYPLVDLGNFDVDLMEEMHEDQMSEDFATDDTIPAEPVYRVMALSTVADRSQARQTTQSGKWRETGSPTLGFLAAAAQVQCGCEDTGLVGDLVVRSTQEPGVLHFKAADQDQWCNVRLHDLPVLEIPVYQAGPTAISAIIVDCVIVDSERGIDASVKFFVVSNGDFWKYRALTGNDPF